MISVDLKKALPAAFQAAAKGTEQGKCQSYLHANWSETQDSVLVSVLD